MAHSASRTKLIASGIIPFIFVVILIAYVAGSGGAELLELGVVLPDITIERVDFVDSEIQATVRNTGPMPVQIVLADINDRIHPAAVEPDGLLERYETALVRIPFEWNVSEPYVVGITTSDGTRFEKSIEAAAPLLELSVDMVVLFAIIGTFVGVIPIMIGMMWLPFIRRISRDKYIFFMALTVGLLLFLALDSVEEALAVSAESLAKSFNGSMLVATVVVLSFLGLYFSGERITSRSGSTNSSSMAKPVAVAFMISIGIGMHNFGEGLAIGAAVGLGSVAFGAFLVVGFALHNTTEGIAIAAPLSQGKTPILLLAALGALAGTPAIFGAWIGGFAYSPFTSVIFLAIGAGAIFQVIVVLMGWIGSSGTHNNAGASSNLKTLASAPVVSGIAVGMLVMYLTSILI